MTVGCGKTARLERLGREVAEEQASLAAEAKADRSYFQIVKDTFYKHSYMYSALILTAAIGTASYLRYYHKPKHIEEQQEDEQGKNQPNFATDTVQTGLPVDVSRVEKNVDTPIQAIAIPEKTTNFVTQAPINNSQQTLPQFDNPISPHSLIGMPNFNKPKTMLALEYHPKTPIDIVIPDQVVNFLNQQPVNNPRQPNSNVFDEPFIQHYEKTFKQKPILMLTYDPKQVPQPETQIEGFQKVNVGQQINIPQMLADYAAMKANHTEPIIVEVNQPVQNPIGKQVAERVDLKSPAIPVQSIVKVPRVLGNAQAPIETVVILQQIANFVRLLQILNPLNELFIPQVPVDFSQTYQPEGYLTLTPQEPQEPVQEVNENPLASVEETVENNSQAPIPEVIIPNPRQLTIETIETPAAREERERKHRQQQIASVAYSCHQRLSYARAFV